MTRGRNSGRSKPKGARVPPSAIRQARLPEPCRYGRTSVTLAVAPKGLFGRSHLRGALGSLFPQAALAYDSPAC